MVEINGYQYRILEYNVVKNDGVVLRLTVEELPPREFTMDDLRRAERLDAHTLRVPESMHHLVFIKFQRLEIDGSH